MLEALGRRAGLVGRCLVSMVSLAERRSLCHED